LSSKDDSAVSEPPISNVGPGDASCPQGHEGRWAFGAPGWVVLPLLLIILNSSFPLGRQVRLVVDGTGREIHTRQATVRGVLAEAGLVLHAEDWVYPAPKTEVTWGQTITVRQARWVRVALGDQVHHLRTRASTVWELLQEMGVILRQQDRLLVNGQRVSDPRLLGGSQLGNESWQATGRDARAPDFSLYRPIQLAVVRAVPYYVAENGNEHRMLTAATTVGEALHEAHILVHRGDRVEPPIDSTLTAGTRVVIHRARPLSVQVDGNTLHTRTRGETVADVLTQEQLSLWDQDYVIPVESTPVRAGMAIRVVRAREETIVEQDTIGFETVWGPSAEVELDQERVLREGQPGIIARRFRIRYEDGQAITRTLQEEWRAQEPEDRLIGYGTKIVSRQVDTPDGPRSYWRKIRVFATSYTAATSGKAPDHPEYGVTRLGWKMRRGIIAVDPRVINFGAQIYVPGYGVGVSADTGGKILGRRVDLGYDEWDLRLWYKWMDIYLLDPPPTRGRIQWVLPDWPQER
jgi:uncharacterized protein YabE (DUF348 family)